MPNVEAKHFLLVLLIAFAALAALVLSNLFAPIILGILLAGLAHPLYKWLMTKFQTRENLTGLITILIISIVIILPFLGLLSVLVREAFHLFTIANDAPSLDASMQKLISLVSIKLKINILETLDLQIGPLLKNLGLDISKEIGSLLSNVLKLMLNFFVMIVTIFYMLRDGKKLGAFLIKFSPLKTSDEMDLYTAFTKTAKAIFYGVFISALIQGILGGIGFLIFGVGDPVLWGAVMAFLALIPFLGPYIIFIPTSIYLFSIGNIVTGIIFLCYNLIIVSTVDNLIKPKIISGQTKIHPLLILLSILGGLQIFGILGIIYGPLIFTIFMALTKLYAESS